jgi:hypothetical protein
MISIVCVYNNDKAMRELLLKSLEKQTAAHEFIKLDNTDKNFPSAAAALNHGARGAKGDYIMFVHQDVELLSDTWLEDAERVLAGLPDLGIAGVAGARDESGIIGNFLSGTPPRRAWTTVIREPEEVQTLDECLVIIPRRMFEKRNFDEKACDGWHLYAVDYCLGCREGGARVYVIPEEVHHLSDGIGVRKSPFTRLIFRFSLSYTAYPPEYYRSLDKVLKKHRSTGRIYTTCGRWDTGYPLSIQRSVIAGLIKYPWTRFRRYYRERRQH